MKNKHILLLSDHRRAETDLPLRARDRYRFTHCTCDAARTVDVVDQLQTRYDWILIDGAMMGGDQREFVRSLRAMGHLLSEGSDSCCHAQSCSVEWDANGRDKAFLWPDERLQPVYAMVERLAPDLDAATCDFIAPEAEHLIAELEDIDTPHGRRAVIGERLAVNMIREN